MLMTKEELRKTAESLSDARDQDFIALQLEQVDELYDRLVDFLAYMIDELPDLEPWQVCMVMSRVIENTFSKFECSHCRENTTKIANQVVTDLRIMANNQ